MVVFFCYSSVQLSALASIGERQVHRYHLDRLNYSQIKTVLLGLTLRWPQRAELKTAVNDK
jgi:hypothetical protein